MTHNTQIVTIKASCMMCCKALPGYMHTQTQTMNMVTTHEHSSKLRVLRFYTHKPEVWSKAFPRFVGKKLKPQPAILERIAPLVYRSILFVYGGDRSHRLLPQTVYKIRRRNTHTRNTLAHSLVYTILVEDITHVWNRKLVINYNYIFTGNIKCA